MHYRRSANTKELSVTRLKEFTSLMDWLDYVSTYMRAAKQRKEMFHITVRNNNEQVIAKWNFDGTGQVWEQRSEQRLKEDKDKNE